MAKQDDYTRYTIRVPQQLYAVLDEAASAANRSVNAEIVERLAYAVEHPPEQWNRMLEQVQHLDDLLDQAETRYDALSKHAEILRVVSEQEFDYQRRLMYHVLNYVDQIPIDLAIWAYDMIAAVERNEFMSKLAKDANLSEADIRKIILERRDNRRRETMEAIKEDLSEKNG